MAHVVFPPDYTCELCGIEIFEGRFCRDCLKTLSFNNGVTCPVCGRRTVRPEVCLECKAEMPRYKKALSVLVYEGGALPLLYKFKNGSAYLKEYFADLLAPEIAQLPRPDGIVCVPMTAKSRRKRGYNQSELLAKSLAERLNLPYLKNAVIKTKNTPEQKELSRRERIKNLAECFKVADKDAIKDKIILLVDDVMTTGATIGEISKKLLAAGANAVYVATVCAVEYKQNREELKIGKNTEQEA